MLFGSIPACSCSDETEDATNPPPTGIAGIKVTPSSGLKTTEAGGQDDFTIVLEKAPTADVTIALTSSDPAEGTVSPASVKFTSVNWNAPQKVTVTGVDDTEADGDASYSIVTAKAVSTDTAYTGKDAADVAVTNSDDEMPGGITVTPTEGLETTEAGGEATFTVVLNAPPTSDVTIDLSSSDETEGTVSPASLTFSVEDWDAPQTVTVTGVADDEQDGPVEYTIVTAAAVSEDGGYAGVDADDVSVTNTDNDTAGVTIEPVSGLVTGEDGTTDTFTVVLDAPPTADVTIALSSSAADEGTVSPATLTFTPANYDAPQTVTVTGVDDDLEDGDQPYNIVTAAAESADANYQGFDAEDVAVTNNDDEEPGITIVAAMGGLVTTESGGTDTFTIVLDAPPTADVTIALSSSDTGEATVSPATVTFTTTNWNAPQTVTATGVDDNLDDGAQTFSIVTAAATSTDAGYSGINADDVDGSNTDNDTPGVTVTPVAGLTTSEGGATATFTVVLNSEPTADVNIAVSSDDTTEGTVGPATLTFTTTNWNAPQTVTLTGVNDNLADGDQPYGVTLAAATSADAGYSGFDPADVDAINTDNDQAGFTVTPVSGLTTNESGTTATFTVVLNAEPTANVTVAVSSSDTGEATAAPASLVFTAANWNAPQVVTVTGVNDAIVDGNQPFTITLAAAVSADAGYSGLNPPDVTGNNADNDAGILVIPTSGLTTTEAGGTATVSIVLNVQPTANVVIGISSSDTTEGTASPSSLTFTTTNWNAPQTVTVTGVDDAIVDGAQPYTIVTAPATSTDAGYSGLNASDITASNTDNDSAGITATPLTITTTEAGGQATFTYVLNSQPTANVTFTLTSSDITEGTVSPASLTFTAVNWNAPQQVTVTGIDDLIADGNQVFTITSAAATSTDMTYSGLNPPDVSATNIDNETAGFTVTPTAGLTTTEAGGQATFTVVLNSQPTSSVTIPLSSNDTTEGTVSPASLVFTTANWNAPQTVTVTGVNDAVADGSQTYSIITAAATSTDAGYSGLNPADVALSNTDNDSAGVTVTPTSGLVTTEAGGTATFTVVLNSQPTANVVIGVSSGDTSEATVGPATLTFTTVNWNAPQTVTVTGVNDALADGAQPYTILTAAATSTDAGYSGLNAADVTGSNTDNDTAGITVTPTSGLVTTEAGGTATFTVVLNSEPTANVSIALSSSDTTEGTVAPATLTFTTANWASPQTVTVTGVNDAVQDGNQPLSITTAAATSADAGYNTMNASDVTASNTDNDSAGITVVPSSGLVTTEAGGTATFTIVLTSEPTASVTIPLSSNDLTEGTVGPASVTFTAATWNVPQTVTVTGVDDFVQDGGQPYSVLTAAATSADPNYTGRDANDVTATNSDNETAGITVAPITGLVTTEVGGQAFFTVVLASQPTANVQIPLSSSDTSEGTLTVTTLTFTPANWNQPQTVTVTGEDDATADGTVPYTINTGASTSTDANYNNINPPNVSVSNISDE